MAKDVLPIDAFPLSVAMDNAFCNRVAETEKLKLALNIVDLFY